jgi:LAS superfamily LD-carboxypeptidase LdcB
VFSITITQSFSYKIDNVEKYTSSPGHSNDHAGAAMRVSVHCPMEEIQGHTDTGSHWMMTLGKYSHRIATATEVAMVLVFSIKL